MTYNCLMTDMKVYFQPRLAKIITLDSQPVDNQQEDSQLVDSQKLDNPELEVVVEHKADHMLEQDIQRWVGTADQAATFAELEELTSVEDQISRLSCPSQPCVASAYRHKPCSRPYQTSKIVTGMPPGSPHFQQSLQLWRICKQVVGDRT